MGPVREKPILLEVASPKIQ